MQDGKEKTAADWPGMIPLSAWSAPSLPTEARLQTVTGRLKAMFRKESDEAFISSDRLTRASAERMDNAAPPHHCTPMVEAIGAGLEGWLPKTGWRGGDRVKIVVLPPGDTTGMLGQWAEGAGHPVRSPGSPPGDDRLEVIPRLEDWFLRTRTGLGPVRMLEDEIARSDRHYVLGCNSWAWRYLSKATGLPLIAGAPVTVAPFGGEALRRWFAELAAEDLDRGLRFRLASSGARLLDDEAGSEAGDFFRRLAARSRGIPWVAWQMWRQTFRSAKELEEEDETADTSEAGADRHTLWIAALSEQVLPGDPPRAMLLVLHALLIHGSLTADQLSAVLPAPSAGPGVEAATAALVSAGFVERVTEGEVTRFRCRPEPYPAIRQGLSSAGLPVGTI